MPGIVQVSVLDFNGPSSSSPTSSIFLKVSMGKVEYQTWDNGDFSFPLTTLRDNLIVTLQDAQGNQISHTGVGTKSIVEKGLWDDLFPLEGGGHVHMRLQFILSKEERDRIRIMRESALKKKRGASTIGRSQLLSSINNEVSDSQAIVDHNVLVTARDVALQSSDGEKEGTTRAQTNPNATDRSEVTSSSTLSQGVKVRPTEVHHGALAEKILTQLPHADIPSAPVSQQEASSVSVFSEPVIVAEEKSVSPKPKNDPAGKPEKIPNNGSEVYKSTSSASMSQGIEVHRNVLEEKIDSRLPLTNVHTGPTLQKEASAMLGSKSVVAAKNKSVSSKLESDPASKPKKRDSLEKTRSSVKKMISAFESGRSQDTRPPIKPPAEKSQQNKVASKDPLKDKHSKDAINPAGSSSERLKNPFPVEDLPQTPVKIMETGGDHSAFDKDLDGTQPSQPTKQLKESRTIYIESTGTDEVTKNNFEAAREETNTEKHVKSPVELSNPSTIETATVLGRMDYHEEHSGGPQPCSSHAEHQDSAGTSVAEERGTESHSNDSHEFNTQGAANDKLKSVSSIENEGSSFEYCGTLLFPDDTRLCVTTGGKEVMELLGGLRIEAKSTHEEKNLFSVLEDERKVIKIAIVVGFGILVLLTRQSEPRKSKRKENDNFYTTPYRMDRESLADEEWD